MTKVIIARGISGSGKTRYLSSLSRADRVHVFVCSADDFFTKDGGDYLENFKPAKLGEAHQECFGDFMKMCNNGMKDGQEDHIIAVSNTNTCLFEMSPYIMYAQLCGLDVEIHEVSIPNADAADYCAFNNHGVPLTSVQGMMARWEESLPFWPPVTKVDTLRASREFRIYVDEGDTLYSRVIPAV
jgi:hypothetical protein